MNNLRKTLWAAVGLFAFAALLAMPAAADQVILDDLIVDGSACVGFDCVNGESFGFDTIRIKENNLRIHAMDTSSAASFPSVDWRLTFNDSANGGRNRFSVECVDNARESFTIEGCAPSNSLYVDDGGRIGLGTANPVVELHVVDGDTPTLRLEQDGSSGFTPQTWDVAGNETNFFIRDVSNGSKLPFRIRPDAPTSSIDVAASGDVGFGTSSPDNPIHIRRTDATPTRMQIENANASAQPTGVRLDNGGGDNGIWQFELSNGGDFQITEDGTGGAEFVIDENAINNQAKFRFASGATQLMEIEADGDVQSLTGNFAIFSDRNKKRDVELIDARSVLARVSELPISTWRYEHRSDLHMGPMAQDFWAAFGLYEGDTTISLSDLSGVALAAIQGLNLEIQSKDAAIQQLLDRVSALEARLAD